MSPYDISQTSFYIFRIALSESFVQQPWRAEVTCYPRVYFIDNMIFQSSRVVSITLGLYQGVHKSPGPVASSSPVPPLGGGLETFFRSASVEYQLDFHAGKGP